MIIPIINRVDWPNDGFFPGSYDFEISPSNAQQIILNNASVKLKTTDGQEHFISAQIYAHYVAIPIEPYDYVWYVVQNVSNGKWYLGLIKDPGNCPWFITYDSIFDVEQIIIDGVVNTIVTEPYQGDEFAFTLDDLEYILNQSSSTPQDTYFQINTAITINGFQSIETKNYLIPEKALPFNGTQKFSISRTIHDLIDRMPGITPGVFQYSPAEVIVSVEERLMSTNAIIATQELVPRFFVAGLSRGVLTAGFLTYSTAVPARVTNRSFKYINMIIPESGYEIRIFKNNELFQTIAIGVVGVCSFKLFFDDFTQGDQIEARLEKTGVAESQNLKSLKFNVWPIGKNSNIIVFEDSYLLKQAFEFTGEYSLPNDFENDLNSTSKSFTDVTSKVSDTVNSKLILNTGFVSPNDFVELFEVSKAKRAWWVQDDKYIEVVPVPKSLPGYNSQQQLVSYNFEFIINREKNEETYSPNV